MRYTRSSRLGYWGTGSLILWLMLPADLFDMAAAPTWAAPNPSCDSFAIAMWQTSAFLLPWAAVSGALVATIVFLLVRKRSPGTDIFRFHLGNPVWNIVVSLPTLAIVALAAISVAQYLWQAAVPQTVSSDCGGKAEMVTLTIHGPLIQLTPFLHLMFGLWVLHIRALLLSPRPN